LWKNQQKIKESEVITLISPQPLFILFLNENRVRFDGMAKTVLVVDDDESVRKSVALTLYLNRGFQILEAEDGLAGLETAQNHKPDLIISDVMMDNLNGFMMLESLKKNPETSMIPVIMMTSPAITAGAWRTGPAIEYLEKGFTLDELLRVVDRILKNDSPEEGS
jgi:CheY-like chemotaxis protein